MVVPLHTIKGQMELNKDLTISDTEVDSILGFTTVGLPRIAIG